jgi:hypothetical protein
MADVFASEPVELQKPLEQAQDELAEEIMETIEVIQKGYEEGIDCSACYKWLAETIESLARENGEVAVVKVALKIRSRSYSLDEFDQAWGSEFPDEEVFEWSSAADEASQLP